MNVLLLVCNYMLQLVSQWWSDTLMFAVFFSLTSVSLRLFAAIVVSAFLASSGV